MIYNFKKILVAIDFSPESLLVLKCAEKIRAATNGELTLLNISGLGIFLEDKDILFPQDMHQEFLKSVRENSSKKLSELAKESGVNNFKMVVKEGLIAETILDFAEKERFDLLITGKGGKGFFHNFLGSVSRKIVSAAKIPVLIAKQTEISPLAGLLPETGALDRLIAQIFDFSRSVKASNVTFISMSSEDNYQEKIKEEVAHFTHPGDSSEVIVKEAVAYNFNHELLSLLKEKNINLAVVARHNKGAARRLFIGSTTLKLLEDFSGSILVFPAE